jgi:hypothetical protein
MAGNHEIAYDNNNNYNINNNNINNCVKFVIWHTLRKLPQEEEVTRTVQLDNDGLDHGFDTCTLTHDWKVHLDVIEGDPRPIIARIEADFGPTFLRRRLYVCNRPRKMRNANSDTNNDDNGNETAIVWRCFESRQKCGGSPPVLISIVGMGGTVLRVKYHPDNLEPVEGYFFEKNVSAFGIGNGLSSLLPIPLPPNRAFSIEQVSGPIVGVGTTAAGVDPENDVLLLSTPNLTKVISWERGEEGIKNIRQSLVASTNHITNESSSNVVNTIISIQLFEDTFNKKSLDNLIKMSQNFIKYEDAMDKIIQINRESRIVEIDMLENEGLSRKSNKCDVEGDKNRTRHDTLASCSSNVSDLVKAMNPRKNQKYKLMFAREEKIQTFTAQFFFHAVPNDIDFTIVLLRFCTLFVHNSFRFQKPSPLKSYRSIEYEADFLFSMLVRDRFVEEMLLSGGGKKKENNKDDGMSLGVLSNFDIDMMNDDEISFPVSVLHGTVEEDEFSDSSEFGDRCSPDRKRGLSGKEGPVFDNYNTIVTKRPRSSSPPTSNTMEHESFVFANAESMDIDVVFRSHLFIENKYYTAAKLAIIGRKLSTGTSNNKTERLKRLRDYFDARDDELKQCIEKNDHHCNSGVLGIEFVFKNDANRDDNNICVILKGGRQMITPRRSVCKSKCDEKEFPISLLDISEAEAKTIFEKLYRKENIRRKFDDYIARIDDYIDELQKYQEKMVNNPCRFALIHDLFSEP